MQTPFEILDVAEDANDDEIKKAYLRKVREFPPEQQGAVFQLIRDAYERVSTDRKRREYRIFDRTPPDIEELFAQALKPNQPGRPDPAMLIGALVEVVKHQGSGIGSET